MFRAAGMELGAFVRVFRKTTLGVSMIVEQSATLYRRLATGMATTAAVMLVTMPSIQATANTTTPLPAYVQIDKADGKALSVGSETMALLMSYWMVQFKRFHPDVKFSLQHGGSAEAPAALMSGANFGSMSRAMRDSERQAFVDKFGYPPTEFRVAVDAVGVFVHKDNPLQGMTLAQVDAIFSGTRKCGAQRNVTSWDEVGVSEWKTRPFKLFGRNARSGTYGFFADRALCKGKFRDDIQMFERPTDIVRSVARTPEGIGYSGLANVTKDVRALPIAAAEGKPFVTPTPENVSSGAYPLSRFLYIYVNQAPGKSLPPLEREFLKMVLSAQGQGLTNNNGFLPLTSDVARQELAKIN
jgi:phosphate transport system substrate-binding protein